LLLQKVPAMLDLFAFLKSYGVSKRLMAVYYLVDNSLLIVRMCGLGL
jgi:hypothetical protein